MISDTMTTFSPLVSRMLSCRKGSMMDDAQQSRAQWRDDLRVLGQEIAALGSAPPSLRAPGGDRRRDPAPRRGHCEHGAGPVGGAGRHPARAHGESVFL